jgi:hypothetical protein
MVCWPVTPFHPAASHRLVPQPERGPEARDCRVGETTDVRYIAYMDLLRYVRMLFILNAFEKGRDEKPCNMKGSSPCSVLVPG